MNSFFHTQEIERKNRTIHDLEQRLAVAESDRDRYKTDKINYKDKYERKCNEFQNFKEHVYGKLDEVRTDFLHY